MIRSRVLEIPLVVEAVLFADSTSVARTLDLDVPELQGLLPHAESLQVEWLLDMVQNNEVQWNILANVGWDRDHELTPVQFFGTDQSSQGSQLAAPDGFGSANYRRHVRLQLRWRLVDNVTVPKQARLSATLYVTTKGL